MMINHARELRSAILDKPPFYASSHTIPVKNELTRLFYIEKDGMNYVDLLNLTNVDLINLSSACIPCEQGVRVMEKKRFATNFEIRQDSIGLDIPGFLANNFLDGPDASNSFRAEIHQLTVYARGSSVIRQNFTPRGRKPFATLIVAFPTPESDGGEFVFSSDRTSWTWDPAKALRSMPGSIAYAAFYSDLDVTISPVKRGQLVTLIYHVYIQDDTSRFGPNAPPGIMSNRAAFSNVLYYALSDPSFLPDGGYLGFGLQCMYPFDHRKSNLKHSLDILKGSDAMIRQVCEQYDLRVQLKAVYTDIEHRYRGEVLQSDYVLDEVLDPLDLVYAHGDKLLDMGGWRACPVNSNGTLKAESCGDENGFSTDKSKARVLWVTQLKDYSSFESTLLVEGHEVALCTVQGYICLMVKVGTGDSMERTSLSCI